MLKSIREWFLVHAWVVLLFVIFLSYGWCFFGIDFQDGFYYLNLANSLSLSESPYMIVMSTYATRLLIDITGGQIIFLRIINLTIYIVSFCLPIFLVEKNKRNYFALLVAVLLLVFSPYITNVLGADTFSALSIVLVGLLFYKYNRLPKLKYYFSMVFCMTIAILFRFPNILLIPLLTLLFLVRQILAGTYKSSSLLKIIGLIVIPIVGVGSIYYLVYNDFSPMTDHNTTHSDSSYDFKVLLGGYIFNMFRILKIAAIMLVVYIAHKYVNLIVKNSIFLRVIRIMFLLFFVIFIYDYSLFRPSYQRIYACFLIALVLLSTFAIILDFGFKKQQSFVVISILLLMFISPAGSNTGLYKVVYVLPLFLIIYKYLRVEIQKVIMLFLIMLIPVSITGRINGVFQDDNIFNLTEGVSHAKLRGVFTTKLRKQNIEEVLNSINDVGSDNYVFGKSSHIFNYLLNEELEYTSFLQEFDKVKLEGFIKSDQKVCFYIDEYPNSEIEGNRMVLKDSLVNEGFNVDVFDNFIIIRKKY